MQCGMQVFNSCLKTDKTTSKLTSSTWAVELCCLENIHAHFWVLLGNFDQRSRSDRPGFCFVIMVR